MIFEFITGNASTSNAPTGVTPKAGIDIPQSRSLDLLEGFRKAQEAGTARESALLIGSYGLPREAIKTEHLREPVVWEALLEEMPMTAMIRNLANLTRAGVLKPLSEASKFIVERLEDTERLRRARIHPINVLSALRIYARGHSELGRGESWVPVESVIDALDAAFYEAFEFIKPAGKRTLLALDVSGSMKQEMINGMSGLSAREGAAAMAMATAHTEPEYHVIAFAGPYVERGAPSSGDHYGYPDASQPEAPIPFPLSKRERLDDVMKRMHETPFGGTDCAVPMIYARNEGLDVDTFIVYTDNETWAGQMHPSEALTRYRRDTGINARLVVVGMANNDFSITDPKDGGMLDVVGFDSSAPATISAFSRGEV